MLFISLAKCSSFPAKLTPLLKYKCLKSYIFVSTLGIKRGSVKLLGYATWLRKGGRTEWASSGHYTKIASSFFSAQNPKASTRSSPSISDLAVRWRREGTKPRARPAPQQWCFSETTRMLCWFSHPELPFGALDACVGSLLDHTLWTVLSADGGDLWPCQELDSAVSYVSVFFSMVALLCFPWRKPSPCFLWEVRGCEGSPEAGGDDREWTHVCEAYISITELHPCHLHI